MYWNCALKTMYKVQISDLKVLVCSVSNSESRWRDESQSTLLTPISLFTLDINRTWKYNSIIRFRIHKDLFQLTLVLSHNIQGNWIICDFAMDNAKHCLQGVCV